MRVFVDTSAAFALIVSTDSCHARAASEFQRLRLRSARLLTTSYVLVETLALLGRRAGLEAVAAFSAKFHPLLDVAWVGEELHERGLSDLLARGDPSVSLVDSVSFAVMRSEKLHEVFAFDAHFESEGFVLLG